MDFFLPPSTSLLEIDKDAERALCTEIHWRRAARQTDDTSSTRVSRCARSRRHGTYEKRGGKRIPAGPITASRSPGEAEKGEGYGQGGRDRRGGGEGGEG